MNRQLLLASTAWLELPARRTPMWAPYFVRRTIIVSGSPFSSALRLQGVTTVTPAPVDVRGPDQNLGTYVVE